MSPHLPGQTLGPLQGWPAMRALGGLTYGRGTRETRHSQWPHFHPATTTTLSQPPQPADPHTGNINKCSTGATCGSTMLLWYWPLTMVWQCRVWQRVICTALPHTSWHCLVLPCAPLYFPVLLHSPVFPYTPPYCPVVPYIALGK